MSIKALPADEIGMPRFPTVAAAEGGAFALSSHSRAREALEFGLSMTEAGFNVFVLGEDQSGRMTTTLDFLGAHCADKPAPDDWVYLNNFRHPDQPIPVQLPAGIGRRLRKEMRALVAELRLALASAFTGEAYQAQLRAASEAHQTGIHEEMEAVRAEARAAGLDIVQTQQGMALVALGADGKPLAQEAVPAERREALAEAGSRIGAKMSEISRRSAQIQAELHESIGDLDRQVADGAIGGLLDALAARFQGYGLARWLVELQSDILDNLDLFRAAYGEGGGREGGGREGSGHEGGATPERRYGVNLLVDNGDETQAPVVVAANPSYENLFGRLEYRRIPGQPGLDTDFTMIRAGALHRANGGILVLRAEALARDATVWEFLKGALRDREIRIDEPHRGAGVTVAGTAQPRPIPLVVKVVIVGAPRWYYTFFSADPDFQGLFKVKADIDPDMDATPENLAAYRGMIGAMTKARSETRCAEGAMDRLLGVASRWAGRRDKLTSRFERIEDLIDEAATQNGDGKAPVITEQSVLGALASRRRRNARVEDRLQESIADGTVMIDTAGSAIGQVNALTVRDMGDHAFGIPARVTARASVGRRGVINIERDVDLGGPIQQKGAMVLQGLLAGLFARRFPVSFNCSITFEQSYGGVDGDSASLAEMLAVLSDLARLPLRQDLAITGSVNQHGEAQAIGGGHHKIEGFFRACKAAGALTGEQGVVLPAANRRNLVVGDDVAAAVADGSFHIWSVDTAADAIELFTGTAAGAADEGGVHPPESVFGRVMARLEEFDRILAERHG